VGQRTVEVVRSLRPEALDELPDLDRFRAAGVFREKALWAIVERAGQTKGWWLGQLGIAHSQSHRANLLRNFISFYHSRLPRSGMAVSPKLP
jgi:hypothetical protein